MQEREKSRPDQKWPFDPMQPGDHEPVRLPDEPLDVRDEDVTRRREKPAKPPM